MTKKIAFAIVAVLGVFICLATTGGVANDDNNSLTEAVSLLDTGNGTKKVYLAENFLDVGGSVGKINVLQQSMLTQKNAIYVIQYDYDLRGATITIPDGCTLFFDGGSLRNGGLKGGFHINDCWCQIFDNVKFTLNESFLFVDNLRPEWFGAKGDYDYSQKTGTNDAAAINTAVNAAMLLGVHKVKFSSKTYYVKDPISIKSGDIVLEGVYGELREDFNFNASKDDISSFRNSTLLSDTDTPIIVTEFGGTHPVVVRDINFRQEYNNNTKTTRTKAIWLKGWGGPQSPFIFEYCHFLGFRHAIYVQSDDLVYNVSKLTIRRCAFRANYWCVYFGETSATSNYAVSRNVSGEFVFEDNACHHNVRGIHVGLNIAPAFVVRNVFEGNLISFRNGEKPSEEYMNYIGLHNSSTLRFESNYFEQNTVKHLKLNVTALSTNYMDSYVTLKDNISVPYKTDGYYTKKICEIEQNDGWKNTKDAQCNHLHILYSDYDFEVSSGKIGLFFHDNIKNVTLTGESYVHLFTKELPSSIRNASLNATSNILFTNHSPIGLKTQAKPTYTNGTIHYGFSSSAGVGDVNVPASRQSDLYLCIGTKLCRQTDLSQRKITERSVLSFADPSKQADYTSAVYNSNEFDYCFAIRRKKRTVNKKYNYQFRPFDAIVSHVGIAYSYKGDVSFYDIDWDFSPENIVLSESVNKLTGQKEGDSFFEHNTSKTLTWNKDGKWVDALGRVVY